MWMNVIVIFSSCSIVYCSFLSSLGGGWLNKNWLSARFTLLLSVVIPHTATHSNLRFLAGIQKKKIFKFQFFPENKMKEPCFRCKRPTYFNDKVIILLSLAYHFLSLQMGPLKDGSMFHKGCFKCWICGTRLSLKTYHNNRNDNTDLEVSPYQW